MTSYWSREQISVLIQLYREHHCLYEVKNKDYKNKRARNIALKEIEEEMQLVRPSTTVEEIKAKLHGLRTTFMAEHKKVLASQTSGTDEVYQPTVWYYPLMSFIFKYANPRKPIDGMQSLANDAASRSSETQSLAEDMADTQPAIDESYEHLGSPKIENDYFEVEMKDFEGHPVFTNFKRKSDEQLSSREIHGKSCKSNKEVSKRITNAFSRTRVHVTSSSCTDAFVAFVASKLCSFEEDEDILQEAEERITQVLFDLQRRLRNKKMMKTSD